MCARIAICFVALRNFHCRSAFQWGIFCSKQTAGSRSLMLLSLFSIVLFIRPPKLYSVTVYWSRYQTSCCIDLFSTPQPIVGLWDFTLHYTTAYCRRSSIVMLNASTQCTTDLAIIVTKDEWLITTTHPSQGHKSVVIVTQSLQYNLYDIVEE